MKYFQTLIFFLLLLCAITKSVLHIREILKEGNISHLKKTLKIGFLCQPFVPILTEKDMKNRKVINYLVIAVYVTLAILLITVSKHQ